MNTLGYGGTEKREISVLNGLDRSRFVPLLSCLAAIGDLRDTVGADVRVHDLGVRTHHCLSSAAYRLSGIIKAERPALLHTHLVQASIVGRLAAAISGHIPVLTTQHNAYYPKQETKVHSFERRTWYRTHTMIALSNTIATHLRTYGFTGPIKVIPTGIDASSIAAQADDSAMSFKPFILSVGHMRDPQKGHDTVIEAFGIIAPSYPNVRLLIAGDGPLRAELEGMVRRLGLADRVRLLGNRRDIPALLKAADVFVLASRWEGFGRVLIEAMALGTPVIASDVEGIPEVLPADERLLGPPDTPLVLAKMMSTVLGDREFCVSLGLAGRSHVQTAFPIEQMLREVESLYAEVID